MELVIPWALVALLYVLGGVIIYQDMKEADAQEPWMDGRYRGLTYVVAVGLWPLLVIIVLIELLRRERRS